MWFLFVISIISFFRYPTSLAIGRIALDRPLDRLLAHILVKVTYLKTLKTKQNYKITNK